MDKFQNTNVNLMYNGEYLNSDLTVEECGLENGCFIDFISELKGGMQIYVKNIEGKIYTIEVSRLDTIRDLKNKISEKSGFLPKEQRLVFKGKSLLDDENIEGVGLQSNSEINLVIRKSETIKVRCRIKDGVEKEIFMQLSDTVNGLKRSICEVEEGLVVKDIEVIFEKRILGDDKSLKECGLEDDSEIDVIAKRNTGFIVYLILAFIAVLVAYEIMKFLSK